MCLPASCAISFLVAAGVAEGATLAWMPRLAELSQKLEDAEAWWQGQLCSNLERFGIADCKVPQWNFDFDRYSIRTAERDKKHELRVALEQSNTVKQQLDEELRHTAARLRDLELELREEKIQSTKLESACEDHDLQKQLAKQTVRLHQGATIIALVIIAVSLSAYSHLRKKLCTARSERINTMGRLSKLQAEFDSELSGAIKLNEFTDSVNPEYEISEDNSLRCVKMACPNASRSDIDIEVICNGCTVTVNSSAAEVIPWTRKIQFKPSDGLCEFKGATLEGKFLKIEFQRSRVHRVRSLSLADAEDDIDPSDSYAASDEAWIQPK